MESSKLKNIVLLTLVITNLLLLLLFLSQRMERSQYRRQALADAVALLEEKGIAVEGDVLLQDSFPAPMQLERDSPGELEVFTALLGADTLPTQRGLVTYYEGALGSAEVRGDGAFSVTLRPGAYPLAEGEDAGSCILDLLARHMDFSGEVTAQGEDTVTVTQCWEGSPIFSCQAQVTCAGGEVTAISGTRLVGHPTDQQGAADPLSLATLLVRFRAEIIDSGAACGRISGATPGYALSGAAGSTLQLTPVLRLDTDTGTYYLSALTGGSTPL